MSKPNRWTHVRVREETSDRLSRLADREGSSKAAVVERLAEEAERGRDEREGGLEPRGEESRDG